MRKTYSKPEIVFEGFTLSTNIAAGCETKVDGPSSGECGLNFGDLVIFVDEFTGCNNNNGVVVEGDDGSYNGICYHVPTGNNNLFNS